MRLPPGIVYEPLTPARWDDFETLFGPRGAVGGCWCMWWKAQRSVWEANRGTRNRAAFRRVVFAGQEPGVLAYHDGRAVGWCAVAPRERYPALERSRVAARVDDEPVWSVTCLFIHRGYRRRGLSVGLLKAAATFVREHGGRFVEGYPVVPKSNEMPGAFAFTGLREAFERAGYREVARPTPSRAVMRRRLRPLRQVPP